MSIKGIFYDAIQRIMELDDVDTSKLYIDGTKIEANAKKNSFVWKKAFLGYQEKAFINITGLIKNLNSLPDMNYETHNKYKAQDIGMIADDLMSLMVKRNINIVYGKGTRKDIVQKYYDQFLDIYFRLRRYINMWR